MLCNGGSSGIWMPGLVCSHYNVSRLWRKSGIGGLIKKIAAVCSAIVIFASPFSAKAAENQDPQNYTGQETSVVRNGEEAGSLILRFYDERPHVPYIGINEYSQYMKQQPLTLHENEDGTYTLENERGGQLICDAEADGIRIPDWSGFF